MTQKMNSLLSCAAILLASAMLSQAQIFSTQERWQGYASRNDSAFFIFDEEIYNVKPRRVLLEGEMRGWDHNMQEVAWQLQRVDGKGGIWVLAVPNPDFAKIKPQTAFKYRVDDGAWLDVPAQAPNQ